VTSADVEGLLRQLAPRVLAALVRHYGHFEAAEDAVRETLLAAAKQWPGEGVPDSPSGWLVRVASRKLIDQLRSDRASKHREEKLAARVPPEELLAPAADADQPSGTDDTLTLLVLCCHPGLAPSAQVALTLRAVGGLTTAEIAKAFLVPEATMAQRVTRAKQRIKTAGARFDPPPEHEWPDDRLRSVLHVLYLIFNEGYTASSGAELHRGELTGEAIRLTRTVRRLLPEDGEVAGLLALMLLIDARRPARARRDGSLVPLAEQDRGLWNRRSIDEGIALIIAALASAPLGSYQLQAAIAAVHAEATRAEDTDWRQIVALYQLLDDLTPSPTVTLEPRRRGGRGAGCAGRAGAARSAARRCPDVRTPPAALGPRPPTGDGRRPGCRPARLPVGRPPDHQPPGTELPAGPRGPPAPGPRLVPGRHRYHSDGSDSGATQETGGRQPPVACSNSSPSVNSCSSSPQRPISCAPRGNPASVRPTGAASAGTCSAEASAIQSSSRK
jgi:RNA polymerase sigma factor (sigma-70 family)